MIAANDVFDVEAFVADVRSHMARQAVGVVDLADLVNLSRRTLSPIFGGQSAPGLRSACALAKWADLSLDRYIR